MPEKKNIIPLLAIAFVVAIICTGVFYGLFVSKLRNSASAASPTAVIATRALPRGTVVQATDLRETAGTTNLPKGAFTKAADATGMTVVVPIAAGEPVTQAHVLSAKSGVGAALAIPEGMRAVSVRTAESPGVVGLLQPGHHVDVQFLGQRAGTNDAELRTILQDVEVLAINPQQDGAPRAGQVVATLLVKPSEADLLSFADSGARLRLTLRNPLDHNSPTTGNVNVSTLLRASAPVVVVPPVNVALRPASSLPAVKDESIPSHVELSVQWIGAGNGALGALGDWVRPAGEAAYVAALPQTVDLPALAQRWRSEHQWDVLSVSRLSTGLNREVSVQAAAPAGDPASATVRLRPQYAAGQIRLKIQPDYTAAPRRSSTEVTLKIGQSAVISGFAHAAPALVDQLFPLPGGAARQQQLVVIVTPQVPQPRAVAPAIIAGE